MIPAERPLVIGHRGAPGYLPEHSLESYRLALRQGADALETDVVMSKDGVLVLRHENELSRTTDVANRPEFADRRTTRIVGGKKLTGWFTEDFTYEEIYSLGAPTETDKVITLDTLLLLVAEESARRGSRIGLHVEVKHPSYFAEHGLPMIHPVLETLRDHGVDHPGSRVWIQSFDDDFVRRISPFTELPLVQLMDPKWGRVDCHAIAAYADAIGPKKSMVRKKGQPATGLVEAAHQAGLKVFVWTLRAGRDQALRLYEAGVDGVFTDYPDRCVAALRDVSVEETA
ncbi:glycerophosphodiester phosphodiesterase family protein [Nocardioides cheoyonin]|uniref:glycerophosphodiester phosphodiesterase family protein n=1 Tax=Nocardioides cheoyonin TaxID=3156615 RepID=UPI0032B594B5